jgi:hypothetical protein
MKLKSRYIVKKKDLVGLVEPHLLKQMNGREFIVEKKKSDKLVTYNRLDIGFKTLYLELINKFEKLADTIYKYDLGSQTLKTFIEPDNKKKNNFIVFKNVFSKILHNLKKDGFDKNNSLLPLSIDGAISNGSHRLSASLHLQMDVWTVQTKLTPLVVDYDYFFKRKVPVNIIEMAIYKWLSYAKNIHIAFLWPSGEKNWPEVEKLFSNVVYKKYIDLTFQGASNLLYQCYQGINWIGSESNNFRGIQKKRMECFPRNLKVKIIFFQEHRGLKYVQKLKNSIRKINKMGFSSIHITDTKKEVDNISSFLLNDNTLHYLNFSKNFFKSIPSKIKYLKSFIKKKKMSENDILIDGSFALETYGIRKAEDIDILVPNFLQNHILSKFENRNNELVYHKKSKIKLIYDPKYYFYYSGLKVISLKQLLKFKKNRNEKKDVLDIKLSKTFTSNKIFRYNFIFLKQLFFYSQIKSKAILISTIIKLLGMVGAYNIVHYYWRKYKMKFKIDL